MKVIRDCVHGDIEFSPEEMKIIHTVGFQRLHGCKQLGLTYHVYPGAKHSRFEHVLGVAQLALQIATSLKLRGDFFTDEGDDFFLDREGLSLGKVLRFAALLHDMGHVPFGHTLEDEMPVISKHDSFEDEGDQQGAYGPSRMEGAVREVLKESENEGYEDAVLQVLLAISKSKKDDELYSLVETGRVKPDHLVLADIIGNTLCADLLDYIIRDHMMTGIRGSYDPRIFRYFGVENHTWKGKSYKRVVIRLVKHGRFRRDALGDLLDILKLRYNLSDKVLFHPLKCSADSMLINAVARNGIGEEKLMEYSDDALLHELRNDPMGRMIRKRDLFKPVFACDLDRVSTFQKEPKEDVIRKLHRNTGNVRTNIEEEIQHRLGFTTEQRPGALIFCPRPDMTLKPVRTLVQWKDGATRRLNEIKEQDDSLIVKQISVLQDIYPRLWRLYLFVRPEVRFQGHKIASVFTEVLKETTGLTATCDPAFENYLEDPDGCWDYWAGTKLENELEARDQYRRLDSGEKQKVAQRCWDRSGRRESEKVDERFVDGGKAIAHKDGDAWVRAINQVVDDELKGAADERSDPPQRG